MASVTQLGYVGIGAKDVEQWEHYATESLGLQSNGRESDGSLFLRMDEVRVSICSTSPMAKTTFHTLVGRSPTNGT